MTSTGPDGFRADERMDAAPLVAAPSREDPVARLASGVVGGPAGRRLAASRGFWRAATVLVLLAVAVLGGGVVQKQHCRAQGWSTPDMFWHACYSDIPVLYTSAHLGGVSPLGPVDALRSPDLGQPPLAALAMWAVSAAVSGGNPAQAPRAFFDLSAGALAVALVVAVAAVAFAAGRRRSWDAAHVALAPVLLTAGLLSYELLGVALVAAALLAWSRGRALAAGLLLGAAAGAAPAAAFLVVPVLALGLRARAVRPALVLTVATAAVWVGVRLLVYPDLDAGIPDTWASWRDASPGYGSLWLVPSLIQQSRPPHVPFWPALTALSASAATAATLLGLVAVAVATFVLAFSTRRRPRLAHVALVAVAGCLIVLKSLPVQSSLLLLPLVALAGLRWRDHLLWATTELAHFVGVWLFIAATNAPNRGMPAGFYLVLVVARLVGIGWLAAQAWRQAANPLLDRVREPVDGAEGEDDPLAGPLRDRDDEELTQPA